MEQKIIKQALQNRTPLPEAIENAPILFLGLELYFRAFMELNTCRPVSMGRGPIPWTAVSEYADRCGLVGADRDDFLYLLQRVDDEYLVWAKEEDEKRKPKGKQRR